MLAPISANSSQIIDKITRKFLTLNRLRTTFYIIKSSSAAVLCFTQNEIFCQFYANLFWLRIDGFETNKKSKDTQNFLVILSMICEELAEIGANIYYTKDNPCVFVCIKFI